MSKILALKERKKTVDTIYRSSCAMSAASSIKVRKTDKTLGECSVALKNFFSNYEAIVKSAVAANASSCDEKKLNLLVGSNKGFCGSFIPFLSSYFNCKYNYNDDWFFIGSKLESLAKYKNAKYLSDMSEVTEEIFDIASKLWQYIKVNRVTSFSIHSFSNSKISEKVIFSNQQKDDTPQKECDESIIILFLTSSLVHAILESTLEENKQRLIAVEKAKTNAKDMVQQIERLYNRARQEKITLELNEITAGAI